MIIIIGGRNEQLTEARMRRRSRNYQVMDVILYDMIKFYE
jgi:hypothetical protein